jgi:hypothetical protein
MATYVCPDLRTRPGMEPPPLYRQARPPTGRQVLPPNGSDRAGFTRSSVGSQLAVRRRVSRSGGYGLLGPQDPH